MNLFLKRAAFFGAALFSCACFSGNKNKPLDTLKSTLTEAQGFLLNKDRTQAIKVLIQALKNEKQNSKNYIELSNFLKKTSEIFISEKAQQSFELALTAYTADKNLTKDKLLETLKIEPQNSLILKAVVFTLLSLKECQKVPPYLDELKVINEYDEDIEALKLLNLICINNKSEALALMTKTDPQMLNQSFWLVNKYRLLQTESLEGQMDTKALPNDYPEIIYVHWLTEKEQKEKDKLADKYKQLCQSNISYDKAYSYLDPWICEHVKELGN